MDYFVILKGSNGEDKQRFFCFPEAAEQFAEGAKFAGATDVRVVWARQAVLSQGDYAEMGNCPACALPKSVPVSPVTIEAMEATVGQKIRCESCGASWRGLWEQVGYDDLRDKNGDPMVHE
jgi:hypothetical protein